MDTSLPPGWTGGGGMCHAVRSGGLRAETVAVHAGGKGCVCETVGDGNFKDGTMATPASDAKGSKVLGAGIGKCADLPLMMSLVFPLAGHTQDWWNQQSFFLQGSATCNPLG